MTISTDRLPIIDIGSLHRDARDVARIGAALDAACCEFGFFYITGHGIDPASVHAHDEAGPRVLRFAAGTEDGDRDGARRARVARLLSGGR